MDDKEYICEACGKIFKNSQALNGHKSHCKKHLENVGRLDIREAVDAENRTKISQTKNIQFQKKSKQKLDKWIGEKHKCECCGKIMTEKYGVGKFCSKSCANTRKHSEETKQKLSQKSKEAYEKGLYPHIGQGRHDAAEIEYYKHPKWCTICGEVIPYERRENETCDAECQSKLRGRIMSDTAAKHGGNSNKNGAVNRKWGFYDGIRCDSSWELGYLLYCLANNIDISRNRDYFLYEYDGEQHKYYPDFILPTGEYIEIKGRYKDCDYEKIAQFPKNKKLIVIDKTNIKPYLNFCKNKYGKDFITLYDTDKNSWMNPPKKDSKSLNL